MRCSISLCRRAGKGPECVGPAGRFRAETNESSGSANTRYSSVARLCAVRRVDRPLNFLHFTTFYPPYHFGGDAMYIYRLSHALAEMGHHVDVVHCVDSYHLLHPGEPPMKFAEHPNVVRHE